MRFDELNEDNFLLFAIKNYENPQAVTKDDFDKDLNHLSLFLVTVNLVRETLIIHLMFMV